MGKGGSSQTPACELAPRPLLTTDTSPAPAFPHQLIFVISNHPGAPQPACKLGVGYGTLAWKGLRVHGPALAGMGSTLTFVFGKLWVPPWLSYVWSPHPVTCVSILVLLSPTRRRSRSGHP